MAVFALVAAAGLGFLSGTARLVLVMVGLDFFIASFAVGVGGTGWLLQGEVFPTAVRGQAASIGATVDWLANFALIEVFPVWNSSIGLRLGARLLRRPLRVAIVFVYRFLPETKGLSVEEIVDEFEREARGEGSPDVAGVERSRAGGVAGVVGSGASTSSPCRRPWQIDPHRSADAGYSTGMTVIGYTMMCEQAGPKELVRDVQLAEEAGFDFAVISDHYFPWVDAMGHSPYAWSVLGAAAQATVRIELMTYVTCPIKRYHPAVVAQKAATVGLLSDGPVHPRPRRRREPQRARHRRRLAAGQRPPPDARRGGRDHPGPVGGRLRELRRPPLPGRLGQALGPPRPPAELGIAASGEQSCRLAGRKADCLIAVEPTPEHRGRLRRRRRCRASRGSASCPSATTRIATPPSSGPRTCSAGSAAVGRSTPSCPSTAAFEAASSPVRPEDVADAIPCGDSVDAVVDAVDGIRRRRVHPRGPLSDRW